MSVEFRHRRPGEYFQILLRRKWLILLPTIAIATSIAWVVWRLPNAYESTTLLIVRPPTISPGIIPALSDVDLSQRLNNVGQLVASRSSLEPIILQYDLYREDRDSGEPMELIIDDMRKDIKVEIDKSRNDVTNGFKISFRAREPEVVRAVTSKLADKYVSAQIEATTQSSDQTLKYLEDQLAEAQKQLDEIDHQRLQYMTEHSNSLPSNGPALISQLSGLRDHQKSLISDIGRIKDQRTALNNQLNDLQQQSQIQKEDTKDLITVKTTMAYGQLRQQKATLEAEKATMLQTLKPANPDVIKKQAEIDAVKKEMDDMVAEAEATDQGRRQRIENTPDLRITSLKSDIQRMDSEAVRQQQALDLTNGQITDIEQRINSLPTSEVALEALNREYQTKKVYFDDLLAKKQKAALAAGVDKNAQGEGIQVVDPANLPQRPVAPKRPQLILLGLVAGLGVGLFLAGIFEVPRLLTVQTKEDAEHYTGLPVLISVPDLLTPQEARRLPLRRALLLAAGIALTLASIPTFAYILQMTRFFDRFS